MSDFLAEMSRTSMTRAHAARESMGTLRRRALDRAEAPKLDLSAPGFDVIAETKLAGAAEGKLFTGESSDQRVVDLARCFTANGAVALSVLTEPTRFDGDLAHLEKISASSRLPVMRKDFLVDPVQVLEARAAGAAGVLLIARLLPGDLLIELTDLALELGMFALVEVFDISDLQNAVRVFDREVLVGVNCRDLVTLGVDLSRFEKIAPHLPDHLPALAESGLVAPEETAAVASLGYRAALIGTGLVSVAGPGDMLQRHIKAGRDALVGGGG